MRDYRRNAVFTIVAQNYIGLAGVLESSVKKSIDIDFYVFIVDEHDINELSGNYYLARDVLGFDKKLWDNLTFKYSLVEFCTSIKPKCFNYLFKNQYNKVIYFDPDVFLFNSICSIIEELDTTNILLTPHILTVQTPFNGNYKDCLFLRSGIFNLGFLGLRNDIATQCFLEWWCNRLINYSFVDNELGTCTDQKWLDLVPAIFSEDHYKISRDLGLNVAPWNFHERKIIYENQKIFVSERCNNKMYFSPLIFVHFSRFNYFKLTDGVMPECIYKFPDIGKLFKIYSSALAESQFSKYALLKYTYDYFENGTRVLFRHRRMYRDLLDKNIEYIKPFSTDSSSFYARELNDD